MVSFACGTTGGVKPAELEPTRATTKITTTRKTSSFPTSVPPTTGGSTTNPPAATDSSNGDSNTPGLGVMYGEFVREFCDRALRGGLCEEGCCGICKGPN